MLKSRLLFILFLFTAAASCFAQGYSVGRTVIDVPDESKKTGMLELHIYYPSDAEGYDVPLADDEELFPVIVFGHGYRMPVKYYENLWSALVPEGYIMILPASGLEMFPSHMDFGIDLLKAASFMQAKNNDPASLFHGRIMSSTCLMGHSMGGGSAVLGASESDIVDAMVLLAPYDTRPSSIDAAANLTLPVLVMAGSNDCITSPQKHAFPIYESFRSNCRTYVEIIGGTHCNMAIKNRLCSLAERTKPENLIPREEQHRILKRFILPWLNYMLKGEEKASSEFDRLLESDNAVDYKRSLPLGSVTPVK